MILIRMKVFMILLLVGTLAPHGHSQTKARVEIGLTDEVISVDAGFNGARLTIFGHLYTPDDIEGEIDIVATIRGPGAAVEIRPLERRHLIWTPGKATTIEDMPGLFFLLGGTKADDIATLREALARHENAVPSLAPEKPADKAVGQSLRANVLALYNKRRADGLFQVAPDGVQHREGGLFSIALTLPPSAPVGDYTVLVEARQDNTTLVAKTANLSLRKVGIERQIYAFAHGTPFIYGLFCVAISLIAGWGMPLLFRRR